jgi:hypothetical protein
MAIEKFEFATVAELKEVIESLGWFDSVTVESTRGKSLLCEVDGVTVLKLAGPGASEDKNYFYTGTRTIEQGIGVTGHQALVYAYKTKNGLLLTHTASICEAQVLLGKTNNGDIAVCMSTSATDSSGFKFWAAAVGETDQYIGTSSRQIAIGNSVSTSSDHPRNVWAGSPQITACQIPTCPSSGTSYIKGARMLVTTTMNSLGTVEINGIRYATTGDLCLSDED